MTKKNITGCASSGEKYMNLQQLVKTKIQQYRTFVFLHIAPYLLCPPHLQLTAVGHCCA